MTFAQGVAIALGRAIIVALIAVPMARAIARALPRRLIVAILAAVWLMPTVVVGYAYSDGPLSLVRMPLLNEILYTLLLALKLAPVAVVAIYLAPSPALSDSARFLRRLAPPCRSNRQRIAEFLATLPHGQCHAPLLAAAAVMLLAFSDFELAALLNGAAGKTTSAGSWSIALHEAQQLQAPLSALTLRASLAAACELVIVGGALWMLGKSLGNEQAVTESSRCLPEAPGSIRRVLLLAWLCAGLIAAAILILPGWVLLRGAVQGAAEFITHFRLGDELLTSLYFASMSTGAVLLILALTSARRSPGSQPKRHARSPRVLLILLSLPGALGGIVVALLLMRLFSLTPFSLVLDTPVPLVLGVSLLLLPPALLLRGLFDAAAPSTAVHLAHLMAQGQPTQRRAGRAILWRLRGRSWFWLGAVLFALAYFELVVSVTLAPIGMTPAIVELYNQMHYGQRALLSAGVVAAMLVPAAVLAVCALAARWTPPFDPPPTCPIRSGNSNTSNYRGRLSGRG